jgi:hypothetical protein
MQSDIAQALAASLEITPGTMTSITGWTPDEIAATIVANYPKAGRSLRWSLKAGDKALDRIREMPDNSIWVGKFTSEASAHYLRVIAHALVKIAEPQP